MMHGSFYSFLCQVLRVSKMIIQMINFCTTLGTVSAVLVYSCLYLCVCECVYLCVCMTKAY